MRNEELHELSQGFATARKIAAAANVLFRLKLTPQRFTSESTSSTAIEILLKLVKAGGKAALSSLTVGNAYQTMAILREMEESRLVKILETPFRTYIILTDRGWRVFNDLVSVLA